MDGTAKLYERDHRDHPVMNEDLKKKTWRKLKDITEVRNDFWSIEEDIIYRRHAELRGHFYELKEEPSSIPSKFVDVTDLRPQIWMCCSKMYWWLFERRSESKRIRIMNKIHEVYVTERKVSSRICVYRKETKKNSSNLQTWNCDLKFDPNWEKSSSRKQCKNGHTRNQSLIILKDR